MPLSEDFKIDEVGIEKYKPTNQDIQNYIIKQQSIIAADPSANLTFSKYLQQEYFADKAIVVVADLSDRTFNKENFAMGDFTGSIIKNTSFIDCTLTDSVFCDVDFDNAYFSDTKLKNIDFRGAALENCKFDKTYRDYHNLGIGHEISGIKFSTTSSLGRIYADIKNDKMRTIERQDLIVQKQQELDKAYSELTWSQTGWLASGLATGNEKYDKLNEQLKSMTEKKIFPEKDYVMHATFQNIYSSTSCTFDPAYVRGSSKAERNRETQYIPLTREQVEEYLEKIKTEKGLSLNDFAKSRSDIVLKPGSRIVADCSSKVETFGNNQWKDRIDLSNLDFTGANIEGAVFAGSLLKGCIFDRTNISKASFERADLDQAVFNNVNADNSNFFNTNLSKSAITNSNFQHAYMSRSIAEEITVESSNFDHANIKHGKWDHAQLANSTFNYAELEGISLISASLKKISMQHAIINKAILNECTVIESNFSAALMNDVKAHKAKFEATLLNQIEAKGIDLSEAELDKLTKLEGTNLSEAILKKITAVGVSFANSNLDLVQAQLANLEQAILEGVTARYANFQEAILINAKAKNINISYSNLEKVQAAKIDLSDAVARHIRAEKADFTDGNFSSIDLTKSKLMEAILVKVQANKAKLEDVDLRKAKLAEANLHQATVNDRTNIAYADITGVEGSLIGINQEHISILQLKKEQQEKSELHHSVQQPNMFRRFIETASDAVSVLRPVASTGTKVFNLYNDFKQFQKISTKLLSDKLLVEERKQLQNEQQSSVIKLIINVEPVLENFLPSLNEGGISNLNQDRVGNIVLPIINSILTPIITPTLVNKTTAELPPPNLFNDVSPQFSRRLVTVGVNLGSALLAGESNLKVQKIYQDLQNPNSESGNNVLTGITEIFSTPRAQKVLTQDLVAFLKDTDNQKDLLRVAENALDERVTRFAPEKLFSNTFSTAIDITATALQNTPSIIKSYNSYMEYLNSDVKMLDVNLSQQDKQLLLDRQKLNVSEILSNTKDIVTSIAPALNTTLPEYLENNKEGVLKFLAHPEVKKNIKSSGTNYELVCEATEAAIPFLVDLLPILTKFSQSCLEKPEELTNIILQTQEAIKAPADSKEATEKFNEVVKSLVSFKNSNSEIKKVVEKELPNLLTKHAQALGPVVDKFLSQTAIGKKFRLKGERILEALGERAPEIGKIGTLFQEGKYAAMIPPVMKVLANTAVLGLIATGISNFVSHQTQRYLVPNKIRNSFIGLELNNIMSDIINLKPRLPKDLKPDLALLLQNAYTEQHKNKTPSSILAYSLRTGNISGLSFKDTDLKLEEFKVKNINLNKAELFSCSFKGSILEECSFSGTIFNKAIDFTGATIDAKTLSTLLPAIEKYNKNIPTEKITLDNVKIIGDISKFDFSKIELNNPNTDNAVKSSETKNGKIYNTNFGTNKIPENKFSEVKKMVKSLSKYQVSKIESTSNITPTPHNGKGKIQKRSNSAEVGG